MTVARQQNLFAAEDWKIAYKVYNNVDFQAYDFDTMRLAMVEYIKTNFPENFNDYIESSEFIAIIELLAFLSQSLAFRMDVNTRENFLETAERRDSVFKLARMLGYNPKRNIPASGLLKFVSIKTTENITDSLGTQLSNRVIYWDDQNNNQSYEQFITILNAAMSKSNRFTTPIKTGYIGGVNTELYQINTPAGSPIAYNFGLRVNGTEKAFNVCNPDFIDNGYIYERHPDPTNLFNLIYRNDTKGLSSLDTGFFFFFRQGLLNFENFNYTVPVESRIQAVDIANINESDVYLQEIDTIGAVINKWTKVPNTVGQTLNYNSVDLDTKNLYAVENSGTNGIRIRFPDGNFGNIPTGLFRLWYRSSDPTRYSIQPQNARNVVITIPYTDINGDRQTLTVTCALQYTVNNSLPPESVAAIKERAPQTFYTQNRMVSAQDYNVFPQSQSSNILKLKATNRTHAGHSRYIDINDPTGTYQNVDTFADDAFLYIDDDNTSETIIINNNVTPLEVVTSLIPDKLRSQPINNFVYYNLRNIWGDPTLNGITDVFKFSDTDNVIWNALPNQFKNKTGYITEQFSSGARSVLVNIIQGKTTNLKQNNFIKWVNPEDFTEYKWSRIVSVENSGQLSSGLATSVGPWTLSEEINNGWRASDIVVSLRKTFTQTETVTIQNQIKDRKTFALGYDLVDDSWYVINANDLTSEVKNGEFALDLNQRGPSSWLILMEYTPVDQFSYKYNLTTRGQDYIIQSKDNLRFYNVSNVKNLGSNNKSQRDYITFTTVNTQSSQSELFSWTGSRFLNSTTGTSHEPFGLSVNLPLKTRDTSWKDIEASWISNFGIFAPVGNTLEEHVSVNRYVTETEIALNTYFQTRALTTEANLVVAPNTGLINLLPAKIVIPFSNASFGENIVDDSGTPYIAYRQKPTNGPSGSEVVFKAEVGQIPYSYGTSGAVLDASEEGRLFFIDYDTVTETGNLEYRSLQNHDLHYSADVTSKFYQDKLEITYINNKDKLEQPIQWQISSVFREADGYVDPRKVRVAPIDSDNDLVPDRPLQFSEYVGEKDLILMEYYTDFDGFTYDRPIEGAILDFRKEDRLVVTNTTVSPSRYKDEYSLSMIDWILVKNDTVANQFANISGANGIVVHSIDSGKTFQIMPLSTDTDQYLVADTEDYFVRRGRGKSQNTLVPTNTDGIVRWQHNAPSDVRVDPSISNVIDMTVLTQTYNDAVNKWKVTQSTDFPMEPTTDQLNLEFSEINTYKAASDTVVFRSSKFKLLFGNSADPAYQAKFRVVKLSDQISDNELKSSIISTINDYFNVSNWEFGEVFYFTELSTYIHQKLGSAIGSIVILPKNITGQFGELFQVKAESNELFISTATVNDIEIISRLDSQTLKVNS